MELFYYHTTIGRIGIVEKNGKISNLYFATDQPPQGVRLFETPLLKNAAQQLHSYLEGSLQEFLLPLAPEGTDFMQRIWEALGKIPYGETASYKDIAIAAGSPKAARAAGMANNRNPLPIFIPCHRVIGASGKLVGYRGGLALKQKLLEIEGLNF